MIPDPSPFSPLADPEKKDMEILLPPLTDEMDIPLMIISAEAVTTVDPGDPEKKKIAAYEIEFKTVVPERFAGSILQAAKDHRLLVHVKEDRFFETEGGK